MFSSSSGWCDRIQPAYRPQFWLKYLILRNVQLAGGLGFEPRLAESESAVLPLDDPPSALRRRSSAAATGASGVRRRTYHARPGLGRGSGRARSIRSILVARRPRRATPRSVCTIPEHSGRGRGVGHILQCPVFGSPPTAAPPLRRALLWGWIRSRCSARRASSARRRRFDPGQGWPGFRR